MAKHSRPTPVIILMCAMLQDKKYGIWKQENGLIADIMERKTNFVMVCYPF